MWRNKTLRRPKRNVQNPNEKGFPRRQLPKKGRNLQKTKSRM